MIALACFSFLSGAVLAQRFIVLVLLPSIFLGALAVAVGGTAAGFDRWTTLLAVCIVIVTLQLGYLAGLLMRAIVVAARAARKARDAERKPRPQAA